LSFDAETGLYYYRARYYDPLLGRFISEDPSGLDGGINFYTYAENDALGYVDPFGLTDCKKPCTVHIPQPLLQVVDTIFGEESPNSKIGNQQYKYGDTVGKPSGAVITEATLDSEAYLIASSMVNRGNQRGQTLDEVISAKKQYIAYRPNHNRVDAALKTFEGDDACVMLHRAFDSLISALSDPGDYVDYRAQVIPPTDKNPKVHIAGFKGKEWVGRSVFIK
jgi:RHS repeat-associated protein